MLEMIRLGDRAMTIRFGEGINDGIHQQVMNLKYQLEQADVTGIIECVPSYAALTIHYDTYAVWKSRSVDEQSRESVYDVMCDRIQAISAHPLHECGQPQDLRMVKIPVCYGGDLGPDLASVAKLNDLTEDEVIAIHAEGEYKVYMIGFAPGFPYMGGMSERIAAPRHSTPRTTIPAGSVGIAGVQTGVYPFESPGGWQLIGRTPFSLFDPHREQPSLLQAGDLVSFIPISDAEYKELKGSALCPYL